VNEPRFVTFVPTEVELDILKGGSGPERSFEGCREAVKKPYPCVPVEKVPRDMVENFVVGIDFQSGTQGISPEESRRKGLLRAIP
jgi:hypothetical protein